MTNRSNYVTAPVDGNHGISEALHNSCVTVPFFSLSFPFLYIPFLYTAESFYTEIAEIEETSRFQMSNESVNSSK